MNDFLQSLRSNHGEKQRMVMTRKSYDAVFDRSNCRFPQARPYSNHDNQYMNTAETCYPGGNRIYRVEDPSSRLQDAIKTLNAHMESFTENQKSMVTAQEKTITMLERQVIAVERLLDCLHILPE